MALQTWVARFVVDHGRVTEEGGRLRSFQRRRLDEPDVDLHVLAEPQGNKGEELGAQALDAIGRAFLQDRLSLTGGLTRSLRSTNHTLLDWNRRSMANDQVHSGIIATVISGTLVYLAQLGDGPCYLRRGGKLQRLQVEDAARVTLGEGDIEPGLHRIDLQPGDLIVGASRNLGEVMDDGLLAELLARGTEEALPELYLLTRDLDSFALFAITCFEGEDEAAAGSTGDTAMPGARGEGWDEPPAGQARIETPQVTPASDRDEPSQAQPVLVSRPPVDISRTVVRLRNDQAFGRSGYARTTGLPRLRIDFGDRRLLQVGSVVAVLLLIVAFVPGLVREGRSEKLDTLVANAQSQLASADAEPDPAKRRALYEETRRLAGEALRLDPANGEAAALRQQATTRLQGIDSVIDLGQLTTIVALGRQITGEVAVDSLTIASGSAYLLDSKGGRIIAVPLVPPGPPAVLYEDGQSYGGIPAKKPVYMTWEGPDVGGRLLVLDAERKLFELRPGTATQPLALRKTGSWASLGGIAAYDGNLYVLDPKGNQVYRYLPSQNGFDSEPVNSISGAVKLTDASGLAVQSGVYVIFKDGDIRRFAGGTDAGFPLGGIDRPLKTAIDVAVVASTQELYVADSGNKRVVVAGLDGSFHRQLVSTTFTDMRALTVDPFGSQLYVFAGDALLTAPLPR